MSDVSIMVLNSRMESESIKNNVAALCERYPSCKGDYRLLVYRYWTRVCGIKINLKTFDEIRNCPSGGTIERRLRELRQEDEEKALAEGRSNKFAASPGTTSKRVKNREVHRNYYFNQAALRSWTEDVK